MNVAEPANTMFPVKFRGESDWICNNAEAEEYALETEYSYCCEMYEERKR